MRRRASACRGARCRETRESRRENNLGRMSSCGRQKTKKRHKASSRPWTAVRKFPAVGNGDEDGGIHSLSVTYCEGWLLSPSSFHQSLRRRHQLFGRCAPTAWRQLNPKAHLKHKLYPGMQASIIHTFDLRTGRVDPCSWQTAHTSGLTVRAVLPLVPSVVKPGCGLSHRSPDDELSRVSI